MNEIYSIYHIPTFIHKNGKIGKIGCTAQEVYDRVLEQGYIDFEVLEEHECIYKASDREIELQLQYAYPVDNIPYWKSRKRILKAQEISLQTKSEWLPKVDWKAREEKINQKEKWDKIKSSPNYINMDRKSTNASWKLKKIVLQYDLDGNFIKEWDCGVRNMPDEYKNAGECAKKNKGTLYGYQWRYKKSDDYSTKIEKFENKLFEKVIQKDLEGNIIKVWDNQTQAAKSLGCTTTLISNVSTGKGITAKGFVWERFVS
jgi:hypothetical protein